VHLSLDGYESFINFEWNENTRVGSELRFAALHILIKLLGATLRIPRIPGIPGIPRLAKNICQGLSLHIPPLILLIYSGPIITGPKSQSQDQEHKAADAPTFKPTEVKRQNKMAAHAQTGAPFSIFYFPVHAHVPALVVLVGILWPGMGLGLFACGLFLNAPAMNRVLVCEGLRKMNANANNGLALQKC